MAIKTTRLKTVQVPKVDTIDLSSQMDGETQTFVLGKKIPEQFETYLIWNSTIYKNTPSRTYYEITNNGLLRTYFDTAPKGGSGRNLALVVNGDLQGESPAVTQEKMEEAIAEEAKARSDADEEIKFNLDVLDKKHTADFDAEIANRVSGDAENKALIDNLATELGDEKTTRQEEDIKLQTQIDGIVNSTDVRDIVDTYASLEAYDKTNLGNRDVIKVLNDETHEGAISYYRFSKTDGNFTFEGAVGPYYTKAESDTLLNAKQNTLVSEGEGQNIKTINGESIIGTGDINIATDGMTAEEREKLNSMLAIKSIGVGLELSETGELTAVGGGSFDTTITAMGVIGKAGAKNNILFGVNTGSLPDSTKSSPVVSFGRNENATMGGASTFFGQNAATSSFGVASVGIGYMSGWLKGSERQPISLDSGAISVGMRCQSVGRNAIRIGNDLQNWVSQEQYDEKNDIGNYSIAIGERTWAPEVYSVAIGDTVEVLSKFSVALGDSAKVDAFDKPYGAIAIGRDSHATEVGEVAFGCDAGLKVGYNGTNLRKITGVYPGMKDTDAANVGQVKGKEIYSGTASVNNIVLSEAATNFKYLEIVGETENSQFTTRFYPKDALTKFQMQGNKVTSDTKIEYYDDWTLSNGNAKLTLASSNIITTTLATGATTHESGTTSAVTIKKIYGYGISGA